MYIYACVEVPVNEKSEVLSEMWDIDIVSER